MSDLVKKGSEIEAPKSERCQRCFKPIRQDGHAGMCSSDCAEAAREDVSQSKLRELVFARDGGRCSMCSTDTVAVRKELDDLKRMADEAAPGDRRARQLWEARIHFYLRMGYDRTSLEGTRVLHEVHHSTEKARGGRDSPDSCVTACLPCHRRLSGDFARERAAARKPKRRIGR